MKLEYTFGLAIDNIRHRHLRSWLTILGIVIGVASIVSLLSISVGVSNQINARIQGLGANIIEITPGGQGATRTGAGSFSALGGGGGAAGGGGGTRGGGGGFGGVTTANSKPPPVITFSQADELRILPGVQYLDARLSERETVDYNNQNTSLTIVGTQPAAFPYSVNVPIYNGRYLSSSDQHSAVIGFNVANKTFDQLNMINRQITINMTTYRIVGILNSSGTGADSEIFIPLSAAEQQFDNNQNASSFIVVASSQYNTSDVASELESTLDQIHEVTNTTEDFTITTAATEQATISSITNLLGLFLGGIASISLIVGGIGVANTMFMSVLEQTKDIGVLKSIGAKNQDVVLLFLFEAGTIGLAGGVLGVLLSIAVSSILASQSVPTALTSGLLIGGVVFSVLIGIIAGIAPARNAAQIPPIEALRYE